MIRSIFTIAILLAAGIAAAAQDVKPWTDWSKKDAEKVLNESSWGQTWVLAPQAQADTTVITNTRPGMTGDRRGESGEPVASKAVKYRARMLSAKPIREAFSRMIVLSQPNAPATLKDDLQAFVDRDFGDFLVVALGVESEDARVAKGTEAMFGRLTMEMLKDKVVLERKDGRKANFIDYKPPVSDGMGGKLVFSRTLDGQPFLSDADDVVKLLVNLSEKQKMVFKFKVPGMNYRGKLEY